MGITETRTSTSRPLTFSLIRELVDDFITVSTDEICSAIKNIYEDTRVIVEPAGALSLAGMKRYLDINRVTDEKIVTIASGANMNFQRMQFVAERALTGEKLENLYAIKLSEKPGSLLRFCQEMMVGKHITEFNYRFKARSEAYIFVGVLFQQSDNKTLFTEKLAELGYEFIDLTENELAKQHVRHMVGGSTVDIDHEVVLRFHFPERETALAEFLTKMGSRWNISLFHYRSHGADFGRVLIGLEVPKEARVEFKQFLDDADYWYQEETHNDAYKIFLNRK